MENLSHNFNEHHIRANHNLSKKTNHQGNFSRTKVRPVSKLCTVPGKFEKLSSNRGKGQSKNW